MEQSIKDTMDEYLTANNATLTKEEFMNNPVSFTLEFGMVEQLFGRAEGELRTGESIYFSECRMLSFIYKQLPEANKIIVMNGYEKVFNLLHKKEMI